MKVYSWIVIFFVIGSLVDFRSVAVHVDDQPLSRIAVGKTALALDDLVSVSASPAVLGLEGKNIDWVTVQFSNPTPSDDDWIGVFSPARFSDAICSTENAQSEEPLVLCTAPIKYQYANYSNSEYAVSGKGLLRFQLINQRADFSFALFSSGLSQPKIVATSNVVTFANPKAPHYLRLAQGRSWDEMTVIWTSGYGNSDAIPFVKWGLRGEPQTRSPAGTLTFGREDMCGSPARTVGWRHPGFIHRSFLKDLWPNLMYSYRVGHRLLNGSIIWGETHNFKAPPFPGEDSLQRIVIFGDLGKAEADGSNEYSNHESGSLNTTRRVFQDLNNVNMVFHLGDISYANGYISQWDQFISQIEPIASSVPYMVAMGNHERGWPGTGSVFVNLHSGGECGVPLQNMFYVPAENAAKFWYSVDYGMFRFCVANTELDWRPGSEQFLFLEQCFASVDRQRQPWLVFLAHRVLGYSSAVFYGENGLFAEPMSRDALQELWQRYKVDIAVYGHAHNYERTCPVYESTCVAAGSEGYSGPFNATTHIVVGGGGGSLVGFVETRPRWSYFQDLDFGFIKLTAFSRRKLMVEYKRSSDGDVYDSFTVTRDYRDFLACSVGVCQEMTFDDAF